MNIKYELLRLILCASYSLVIIVYELVVLGRNTWNYTIVCKLFVFGSFDLVGFGYFV